MYRCQLTPEIQKKITEIIDNNPSAIPSVIADELGISHGAVFSALPKEMCQFSKGEYFDPIWESMRQWKKVTFIIQTPHAVIEVKTPLPGGSYGFGFFNLREKDNPLEGHLRLDGLCSIGFVDKMLFSLESKSVQFFDTDGNTMFAVYVGRENKELISEDKESFINLRKQYALQIQ